MSGPGSAAAEVVNSEGVGVGTAKGMDLVIALWEMLGGAGGNVGA